jgi:hypothetical protein
MVWNYGFVNKVSDGTPISVIPYPVQKFLSIALTLKIVLLAVNIILQTIIAHTP